MEEGAIHRVRARRGYLKPEERDGHLVLQGEVEWLVTGSRDEIKAIAMALPGLSERLADDLLLLDFGNAVGLFDLPVLGRIEIVAGKCNRNDYDWMLADLMKVASALPFSARLTAALPYDRSVAAQEDILYHAFVYLRQVALSTTLPSEQRLIPALELILREPHRRFEQVKREVPVELLRRFDASSLLDIAGGRSTLFRTSSPTGVTVRGAPGRYLPERVVESQIVSTHDTPENRFVKTFLRSAQGIVEGMRQVVLRGAVSDAFARRVLLDCDLLDKALLPIVRHRLWDDIGAMTHLPASSTVLQRSRGYREVFGHFARLRLAARVPLTKELVRDLLEAKDVAQLYELWCYFSVVRELEALLGPPSSADRPRIDSTQVTIPWDLEVSWPDGTRLLYNPRFSRSRPPARRSYSVPLRPDTALEVPSGPNEGLHLLDAKFSLERLDVLFPKEDTAAETDTDVAEERRQIFTRGDLYKMHTYRDAIPRARSVWILYPGTEGRFYSAKGADPIATLEDLPATVDGVGGIPLVPGEGGAQGVSRVLRRLLSR